MPQSSDVWRGRQQQENLNRNAKWDGDGGGASRRFVDTVRMEIGWRRRPSSPMPHVFSLKGQSKWGSPFSFSWKGLVVVLLLLMHIERPRLKSCCALHPILLLSLGCWIRYFVTALHSGVNKREKERKKRKERIVCAYHSKRVRRRMEIWLLEYRTWPPDAL